MINKSQLLSLLNLLKLPYSILNKYGIFVEVNEEYCRMYGYNPSELIGNHFSCLFDEKCEENIQAKRFFSQEDNEDKFLNAFGKYKSFFVHPITYKEKNKKGEIFYIQTISYDYDDETDNNKYRISIDFRVEDSHKTKIIENLMSSSNSNFISFDSLKTEIDKYMISTKNTNFSLINIKLINAVVEEDIKSELFNKIYRNLIRIFGDDSIIAYKSSNRFILFYRDIVDDSFLKEKCRMVIEFFNNPIRVKNRFFKENVKIGITHFENGSKLDLNELYKETEIAMKFTALGKCAVYDQSIVNKLMDEIVLNSIVFNGYKREEFTAYYQPYYDIKNSKFVGMEALMRLITEKDGIISPGDFIPLLEKNAFIIQVEELVIEKIFKNLVKWKINFNIEPTVSINLSSLQFKNLYFLKFIKKLIKAYEINPEKLTFEITESTLMEDVNLSSYMLNEMKNIGMKLSIDDFGTGYSSLAYLKEFPIDNLKIDMSFIRDIHLNKNNQAIVSAIIVMAKKLGLTTICEGVEKKEELETIKKLGADIVQGYIFARPMDESNILNYMK